MSTRVSCKGPGTIGILAIVLAVVAGISLVLTMVAGIAYWKLLAVVLYVGAFYYLLMDLFFDRQLEFDERTVRFRKFNGTYRVIEMKNVFAIDWRHHPFSKGGMSKKIGYTMWFIDKAKKKRVSFYVDKSKQRDF